jgi:GNAT superfamily N-acetyltransferase
MTHAPIAMRSAVAADLESMIAMLAEDTLGSQREDTRTPLDQAYIDAFDAIAHDPNQLLAVAACGDRVMGMMQLTFIPGLSRRGAWRGQIESVRVSDAERGAGIGKQMFEWAISECRTRGCGIVQLTTDASRTSAHAFYERLGFRPSHLGYKLAIGD